MIEFKKVTKDWESTYFHKPNKFVSAVIIPL